MPKQFKTLPLATALISLGAAATIAPTAFAQNSVTQLEEVVITGLRGKPRSAVDSAVPIDTFNTEQIEAISHTDTVDILQTLVPSFNVNRQPISDGASFIRPIQLRGLDSHHALVLVNGKRRHRSSLVQIGGSGTQGPDVATIPASAIQSIEVLRDGASSQYGSDAIAGVLNFNLKTNNEGVDFTVDTGQFYEGDGASYTVQGNIGLPLGENGFVSISGEVFESEFTERAEQYCEAWFCLDTNNPRFEETSELRQGFVTGTPTSGASARVQGLQSAFPGGIADASVEGENAMPWGVPNREHQMFFVNAGYDLANGMELYAFGNYGAVQSDGSFFYRYPGNGTIEDLRQADGSIYSPLEKFPGGFTPRFEGEVEDISAAAGLRGSITERTTFDISARFGSNEIDYRLFNTINPSLGAASPTDFRPGTLTNEEVQLQLDLVTEFDVGLAGPLVFAYGASYLDETYDVGQSSQAESYSAGPHAVSDPFNLCNDDGTPTAAGLGATNAPADEPLDCANPDDPVYQVVGVGSNGFPGYSPAFSEEYTRDSYAFYGDLSADLTDQFLVQGALRYEDYSDFGSEVVGKIAARYRINDTFALRGSFGTGFRAPTPGQQGTTNVSTRLPNGFPVATGLFPAGGTVAQALGAQELAPETSTSFTLGFTAEFSDLSLTFDAYSIDIDDRFRAVSTLDVSADPDGDSDAYERYLALVAAGVVGAESIGGVNYFQNAIDTETIGFDLVANYAMQWDGGQSTDFSLALNYNEQEVVADTLGVLNAEDKFDLENQLPNLRWNATAFHTIGDFSVMARARYFGESEDSDNTSPLSVQTYDPTIFFDLEGSWQINQMLRASIGGRNIFDEYPDEVDRVASDNDYCCGRIYASTSVVDWQGGYYYLRLRADF
ncbi:TonB-dependent receptor [Congregibacter variabilis]|uniref:TonB-dependent receptor n=1 Tax=Congregibacter variabilis TaxID=3081200 RepID=A0ABZ0I576_9GAMM|nr:TonB-dependent receptor [Congregibacter sp. IMCC43200]